MKKLIIISLLLITIGSAMIYHAGMREYSDLHGWFNISALVITMLGFMLIPILAVVSLFKK